MKKTPSSVVNINPRLRYQPRELPDVAALVAKLQSSSVEALSRAITLLESELEAHRVWATALLRAVAKLPPQETFRLGISGSPGVGKSTFIEAFGLELIKQGHKVAVLAVDPSSNLSGGSILGDKTRMEELGHHPNAYVRPSPSGGFLGGVSRVTRETILLCEAAGFDYILVETVGVGQSEMAVHSMTDAFLLLAQPGAGDELQGIKRGILELADLLVVNKVDILSTAAKRTAAQLKRSLHLAPARTSGWTPAVLSAAALTGQSIYGVYTSVESYRALLIQKELLVVHRKEQQKNWLEEMVTSTLLARLKQDQAVRETWSACEEQLLKGQLDVHAAAAEILRTFQHTRTQNTNTI